MSDWISVTDRLPCKPGLFSEPVMAAAREFGYPWKFYVVRCWISVEFPLLPKWYLDRNFYNIDEPFQVGPQVFYWMDIPPVPGE